MPTIKETVEFALITPDDCDQAEARQHYQKYKNFNDSVEVRSYWSAKSTAHDLEVQISRLKYDRDKFNPQIEDLERKLKIAEHTVEVLGSVQVD